MGPARSGSRSDGRVAGAVGQCPQRARVLDRHALAAEHDGRPWQDWPAPLRDRAPDALAAARARHAAAIDRIAFEQYRADRGWTELRAYANAHGVALFGERSLFRD